MFGPASLWECRFGQPRLYVIQARPPVVPFSRFWGRGPLLNYTAETGFPYSSLCTGGPNPRQGPPRQTLTCRLHRPDLTWCTAEPLRPASPRVMGFPLWFHFQPLLWAGNQPLVFFGSLWHLLKLNRTQNQIMPTAVLHIRGDFPPAISHCSN